ncbi:MAG TPA: type II toxin-antitoxin system HicB family antitoxin [Solirubrobacteraceae bacterium]|jgi:predicted RNase H-like HicB family nuclease|nr:type II toxin-antitoxin system HicB family antitoxin [Solirubrobacteraceae bacterium]
MTEYLVIYETGEDGGWGAYSPDVPCCVAAGQTKEEVEKLMREALPDHIALMREVGEPVPQPHHVAGLVAA